MRIAVHNALLLTGWLVSVPVAATRAEDARGGTESNLGLGAGGRGIGLAGAFLARVDDATALYWNPAGLARLERGDAVAMHAPIGFGDASQSFVGVAWPSSSAGSFAVGYLRLASGGIEAYDAAAQPLGTIEFAESSVLLGYAMRPAFLGGGFALGLTAKTLTQSLTPWSSTSAGLDVGLGWTPRPRSNLALAVVWQDAVAPRPRLDEEVDVIPSTLHLAGSMRVAPRPGLDFDLHLGIDRVATRGWSPKVGLECAYRDALRLRVGGSRHGAAVGVGIAWSRCELDYARLSQAGEATHPVSLRAGWGRSREARRAAHVAERERALRTSLQELIESRHAAAATAYESGRYAEALDGWKLVAGLDPEDERAPRGIEAASVRLAELQARTQADETRAAARAAQFALGLRYYAASDYLPAREVWRELRAQDSTNVDVIRYLEKTEEMLRSETERRRSRARQHERAKEWVQALVAWTEVRELTPEEATVEAALDRCRAALERAAGHTGRVARDLPRRERDTGATGKYREALARYASGDVAAARALLVEVRRADPDNEPARDLLSRIDRPARALTTAERDRVREMYLRGMSYFTAQQFEQAIAEWSKILALDPTNTSVAKNIEDARARMHALQP